MTHPKEAVFHIEDLRETLIEIYRSDPMKRDGFPTTRWHAFNDAFGGFHPKRLFVVTGDTGCGKTTWTTNWLMDTVQQGHKSFVVSLEDPWEDTAERLGIMISKMPIKDMGAGDMGAIFQVFKDLPLWYLDWTGRIKYDELFETLTEVVKTKGVRFVLLDNMDYIALPQGKDLSAEVIRDFMCNLNGLCQKLDICIVLVVHPAKLSQKGILGREIGMDELKGSSAIKQVAHGILSIFQPKKESTEMALRFQKIKSLRYSQSSGGIIRFSFNPKDQWFTEISPYLEWGNFDEDGELINKRR